MIFVFGFSVLITLWDEHKRDQNVLNARFSIFAPADYDFYIEYLRNPGNFSVPRVESIIKTPLGEIRVYEGEYDINTQKLFIQPNKCDIDEIYDYFRVYGKSNKSPTEIECIQINNVAGWTVLRTAETKQFGNLAPFAAVRDNTIIVFYTYSSDFRGTLTQSEEYVLEFLREAKEVDPKTLLR